jgi:hypothetical protein
MRRESYHEMRLGQINGSDFLIAFENSQVAL